MLELDIPHRTPPRQGSFDTRPAQVEAWLAALPMANVGETTRQLYQVLTEVNGLDIPVAQRFKMLELLRPAVRHVTDAMKKHFVGHAFPLPEKNRRIARLSREILAGMAMGYKIAAHDEAARHSLRKDTLNTALHRALHYLGATLLKAYQVYAPYPAGIWREIHRLYAFAEAQGLADHAVKDEELTLVRSAGMTDVYKQILLLALACPYRLRQGEVELVHQALERWTPHVGLSQVGRDADANGLFVTNLDSDDPPTYLVLRTTRPSSSTAVRMLDTSRLAEDVRTALTQLHRSRGDAPTIGGGLTEGVLRRLMLAWGVMPKRKFSRSQQHSTVMVAMGLSAAHYFMSGEMVFSPEHGGGHREHGGNGDRPVYERRAEFRSEPVAGDQGRTPDIWELSLLGEPGKPAGTAAAPAAPADDTATVEYRTQTWKMVNVSAGGYCLLWDSEATSRAQVGELVGIREVTDPDAFHWGLGVIRWMKCVDRQGLELGVQMISPGAVAIGSRPYLKDSGQGQYLRSLLLPEIRSLGQPATLLTPALPYHVGSTVTVNIHGKETRVRLTKMLENTGTFAQFHFTPLESQADIRAAGGEPGTDQDFDSLWGSI